MTSRESSSVISSSSSYSSSRVRGSSAVRSSSASGTARRSFVEGSPMTPIPITINSRSTSHYGPGGSFVRSESITETKEELVERFSSTIKNGVTTLKEGTYREQRQALSEMHDTMRKAWAAPRHGREVATTVSDVLRESGGLEILITKVEDATTEMRLDSARVLEQSMTASNRDFLVNSPKLDAIVAFSISKGEQNVSVSRVGTGLLGHLFKHSEETCHQVIKKGALDAIVKRCGAVDRETLRQCAIAFANLAMYGGEESQQIMVKKNVPDWLFHLAFSTDDITRYYACLAICALVANKEFEAAVSKSGTLSLVEPFIESHDPAEFAVADVTQIHGQSEGWLVKLLPVLDSTNQEAQSLSAFHFAMEANIKGKSDEPDLLKKIGAVDALMKVASCPNDTASKLAAKALRTIGEDVPHRLPQQVQLWKASDVHYWVKNVIDFPDHAKAFLDCKVDGDLLLQMADSQLLEDIGMSTGLHRKRFIRHLNKLKTTSDYSSCDHSNIDDWLMRIGALMTQYTYNFNRSGITRSELPWLTEEQLRDDIGISNGIHRKMIIQAIQEEKNQELAIVGEGDEVPKFNKNIDVFISYRRSNGSQLASLLKVHLQLRNFVVFIDIEKLEAGKFDENLLNSVRSAKHFILVLTPNALDRCVGDDEQNDWVHKEITTALNSGCNIIPITDDFTWPQPESLPEDMRKVCYYNGVKWIHDYQDACIAKIIRFIKGEAVAASSVVSRSGVLSNASGSDYQPASLKESRNRWESVDLDLNDDVTASRPHVNGGDDQPENDSDYSVP